MLPFRWRNRTSSISQIVTTSSLYPSSGIITREDAKRFHKAVLENATKRVSKEVADRINANYEKMNRVAKF